MKDNRPAWLIAFALLALALASPAQLTKPSGVSGVTTPTVPVYWAGVGGKTYTLGTSAAVLAADVPAVGIVFLKADDDNTGDVRYGDSGVTSTDGYRLKAGQSSPPIVVSNLSKIYALGSASGQKLHVHYGKP